jgi:hypothetical protein
MTWTPIEWQDNGKWRNWVRDRNNDFVDDLIETKKGEVKIIVDLNQCISNPANSKIVKYLKTLGDVTYMGKYLSFVVVTGVDATRCVDIANQPEVAMVELATKGKWLGDNLKAAKVESSNTYQGKTLQDSFGWPGNLNGNGINIALLDSGVGPAYDPHFKFGYNALTDTEENPAPNPNPNSDHATWMASWIWNAGGIAPQAGLIDIKVGQDAPDAADVAKGLEKVYEKQSDWNINIVSLACSLGLSTGDSTVEKLIDLLSGRGVVVVAAAGSNVLDSSVESPGSANWAICTSAADIHGTVDRADDTATYVKGPRYDDGAKLESLKPEVVLPTGEAGTAISTSIATTLTSGVAALILQNTPDLKNSDNKAVGSVKDLLIRSAEAKGNPDTNTAYPQAQATWNKYWGFGEVDAYTGFQYLSGKIAEGRTDLTFKGFDNSTHPSSPWYYSHAIETQSERQGLNIAGGVADKVFARVFNKGTTQDAHNVRVSFGFYPFTAGIPSFYHIGSKIVPTIQANSDIEVAMDWTPPILPAGSEHGCILVSIDYGLDTDFSNMSNFAQKNVQVKSTSSPAIFNFRVENTLPTEARIDLKISTRQRDWKIKLSQTSLLMTDDKCAQAVRATVEPPANAKPGTEALFFITAYATSKGKEKSREIGGVALKARFERK